MLAGPYPVDAVVERLRELAALRLVSGAGADALNHPPVTVPAAYVVLDETGRPGDYTEHDAQPISVALTVVLWVRHAATADTGAAAAAEMRALERQVRTHLRGWSPGAPFESLYVARSGGGQMVNSYQTRQVRFGSEYRDQETP